MYDGTLAPLVDRWLTGRRRRGEISKGTAYIVGCRFRDLVNVQGERPLSDFDADVIDEWRARIGPLAPATRRAYLSSVKLFCLWLQREGLISRDPTTDVPKVREPRHLPRARPPAEITRLLDTCKTPRDRLIVHLMVGMGLRCIEVAQLEVGDYDDMNRSLHVRGKFDDERVLPVPIPVAAALEVVLDQTGWAAGPLVRSSRPGIVAPLSARTLSSNMVALMRRAGIKKRSRDGISAHALRHTAASDVYARCHDPRVIQEMLGHQSLTTTQRYLRRVNLDQLRSAMEGRTYGAAA